MLRDDGKIVAFLRYKCLVKPLGNLKGYLKHFAVAKKRGKFVVVRLRINGQILSLTLNFVELMKEKRKRHLYDEKTGVA